MLQRRVQAYIKSNSKGMLCVYQQRLENHFGNHQGFIVRSLAISVGPSNSAESTGQISIKLDTEDLCYISCTRFVAYSESTLFGFGIFGFILRATIFKGLN
jgi:hypothetical protein